MARNKIDYGIDLGTTNSTICRMENGESVIKKTDALKDTMPSCVYVNKKQAIQVGESAYNALKRDKSNAMRKFEAGSSNAFIEFKRTMGTDKAYYCANLDRELTSEELSAEVLKTLKSFITDESVNGAVITVPAMFTINQKDATLRAAIEHAGFRHCELLQEPIAASMAYGLDAISKDGHWLVFDFGGGTFDAALVRVEEGIMKVIDTEGDNHLGGKNLDSAIVDEIIIPYFQDNYSIASILDDDSKKMTFQEALKSYAETVKIELSFNEEANILSDIGDIPGEDDEGEEFELDITITQDIMHKTLSPIFQKAIGICQALLERNGLTGESLESLILVGGPTYSPILRKMLEEQIKKPDVSVDPMTVVAKGAALFASTIDISDEIKEEQRDKTKIQLELGYEATTVENEEFVTVKILKDKSEGELPEKVFVELVRNDRAWASGKSELDDNGEVIEVELVTGKPNAFNALIYNEQGDILPCEPSDFTIIQGAKIGSATLPFNIGIEIKSLASGKLEFRSIKGLEKNQSTPAIGTWNGLKTQNAIRPGIKGDTIKVAIYQGAHDADGTRAIHQEHVYDAIITGDDFPKLLPEGSDVDLTLKVDESERVTLSAYFPALDFTIEPPAPSDTTQKEVDTQWLESEIENTIHAINLVKQDSEHLDDEEIEGLESDVVDLKKRFDQSKNDYDRKKEVLGGLRKSIIALEKIQSKTEWPKIEEELKEVFYNLEGTHEEFGNERSGKVLEELKEQIPGVIKDKNVKVAQDLIDNMRALGYFLVDKGLGVQMEISHLKHLQDEFDTLDWTDRDKARMTLDRGLQMAANDPVKEQLKQVVFELFKLLPEADRSIVGGGDGSELIG